MKIDLLERVCNVVGRQVNEYDRRLKLLHVVHHSGQRSDAISMEEHGLSLHPAGAYARNILRRPVENDASVFLGVAAALERTHFGFSSRSHLLGLATVNADQYADSKEARIHLYHMAWHALDLANIRERPGYKSKFRNGPMIPRRSPMNMARANMQADVFSASMMALQGDKSAIRELAEKRADQTLGAHAGYKAEEYPYVIAMEAAQFAFDELSGSQVAKNRMVKLAARIADEVGMTFDDMSIRRWIDFSGPAQDMAWRGCQKEDILGAAVNTSDDPYVRATGLLVSEVSGILPKAGTELTDSYNAYAGTEFNSRLHKNAVDDVFEGVVTRGVQENSSTPFVDAANEQNKSLAEGRIMGWCAAALQSSADAFENALEGGRSPGQAARLEFEVSRSRIPWDSVSNLGDKITEHRRLGYAVTFSDIVEICKLSQEFDIFMHSVEKTMQDPEFQAQMNAIHEMSPAPAAPAPVPSAPSAAPVMEPEAAISAPVQKAAPAPALGGPARRQQILLRNVRRQQQGQKNDAPESGGE